MPLAEQSPASTQDQERGSEEEKTKIEARSTDKIPANEAQRTSPTLRSATAATERPTTKTKIIEILYRLTKRRQDEKIDKLINYLFGDNADYITDPDITGEIKSPTIENDRAEKHPIIDNVENKSPGTSHKACVQSRP